ncbi:hypothetical protein V2G26_014734 [Clonostachys chloroleuca]
MDPVNRGVDWDQDRNWIWPAWKFDYDLEEIFTTLHYQHNTIEIPLQDFTGFFYDVHAAANEASTREEFHRLLDQRKKQRTKELLNAFDDTTIHLTGKPSLLGRELWGPAVTFFRHCSMSALVMFWSRFLTEDLAKLIRERREERNANTKTNIDPASSSPNQPPLMHDERPKNDKRPIPAAQHSRAPKRKRAEAELGADPEQQPQQSTRTCDIPRQSAKRQEKASADTVLEDADGSSNEGVHMASVEEQPPRPKRKRTSVQTNATPNEDTSTLEPELVVNRASKRRQKKTHDATRSTVMKARSIYW